MLQESLNQYKIDIYSSTAIEDFIVGNCVIQHRITGNHLNGEFTVFTFDTVNLPYIIYKEFFAIIKL